jgi:hypothetical protein
MCYTPLGGSSIMLIPDLDSTARGQGLLPAALVAPEKGQSVVLVEKLLERPGFTKRTI